MPETTLISRCQQAHHEAVRYEYATSHDGTRAMLEYLAAELTVAGHQSAAAWVLKQLVAEVIELRPRTEEPA